MASCKIVLSGEWNLKISKARGVGSKKKGLVDNKSFERRTISFEPKRDSVQEVRGYDKVDFSITTNLSEKNESPRFNKFAKPPAHPHQANSASLSLPQQLPPPTTSTLKPSNRSLPKSSNPPPPLSSLPSPSPL